jgi:hypothetical protein
MILDVVFAEQGHKPCSIYLIKNPINQLFDGIFEFIIE